jgi:uncharacterized membrane protein YesL
MAAAFRVIGKTLKDIWGEMFYLVLMNLFTLMCIVLIIPGPAAWVALYHIANRIANDYALSWDHYFAAFRQYFVKAWKFAIFALFVTVAIPFNILWYPHVFGNANWVSWVQGAWMALLLFWLAIAFYVTAFFAEQETKSWRIALRNSALIAAANPLFTLTLLIVVGLLIGLSLLLTPVFLMLGLAIWALFGSEAVVNRVSVFRERIKADQAKSSTGDGVNAASAIAAPTPAPAPTQVHEGVS